MCEKNKRSAAG